MILHSLCLFVNFWRFLCLYTHELYYFCKKIPEVLWGELILSMCYIPSF